MPSLTKLEVRFRAPTVVDGTLFPSPNENIVLAMQKLFEAITHNPKVTYLEVWSIGDRKPDLLDESCSKALINMIEARETPISLTFRLSIFSSSFIENFPTILPFPPRSESFAFKKLIAALGHQIAQM